MRTSKNGRTEFNKMLVVRSKLRWSANKKIFGSLKFRASPVIIIGYGKDLGPNYYDRILTDLAATVENCATN